MDSCKKSNAKTAKNPNNTNPPWNGKPASRSSSFTIAERKKSFEMMQTNIRSLGESKVNTHSSQVILFFPICSYTSVTGTSIFIPESKLRMTRYSDYPMVFQNIRIFLLKFYSKKADS